MIWLGVLVVLASGQAGGGEGIFNLLLGFLSIDTDILPQPLDTLLNRPRLLPEITPEQIGELLVNASEQVGLFVVGAVVLFSVYFLLIGIVWFVSNGALIDAAHNLLTGTQARFWSSAGVAWKNAWDLIIIATIPPIPLLIGLIIDVIMLGIYFSYMLNQGLNLQSRELLPATGILFTLLALVMIPTLLVTTFLALIKPLADRACLLEGHKPVAAFKRGWQITRQNFGPFILILLAEIIFGMAVGSILFVPRFASAFCFVLMPLLWIIYGLEFAFVSTVWTAAWQEWTAER